MNLSFFDCQKAIARISNLNQQVEGTGFLISSRYLLTCAHVVINTLKIEQEHILEIPQQELCVDFPSSEAQISRRGKVIIWQPCPTFLKRGLEQVTFGEDIALLELNEEIRLSEMQPIELLCLPLEIFDNEELRFSIYGFPSGSDNGKKTEGIILGRQGKTKWLQLQVTENRPSIYGGYSGSPLFSETSQGTGIVGMTVASEYYYSKNQEQYIGGKEAYAIPALALAEVWLKQGWLIECLSSCDKKWIEKAYNHCRQRTWTTKLPQKIEEYVQNLYKYSQEDADKNCLVEFVVYLVTKTDISEILKVQLRQWAEKAYQVTELQFGEQCDRLKESLEVKQTVDKAAIDSRLWIIINEAGTADQYKIESVYFIKDINNYHRVNQESYEKIELKSPSNVNRSQLQSRKFCFSQLTEIINKISGYKSLWVEFFLPFKSLDLKADSWLIEDDWGEGEPFPIGTQYPVVIRVLERLGYKHKYNQVSEWKGNWKDQHLQQLSEKALICCDRPLDEIRDEITKEKVLGVRCTCPIKEHHNKPKPLIMREGLPIALWFRQELKKCCGKEKYQELLGIDLNQLPRKLRDIRNADLNNENHLARHISLMWDNPTKLPFDAPTFSDAKI